MGSIVNFKSNGNEASGYLSVAEGSKVGIIVLQEWWGLVDHIKDVCDRFSDKGITALAPDLYHGKQIPLSEPDEAGKEMMALKMDETSKDLNGAIDEVLKVTGANQIGVTGFCMGGGLALVLACNRPDVVKAVVPFYGLIPWADAKPDYAKLDATVLGHYAENDGFASQESVLELENTLKGLGKNVEFTINPGVDHAFFNDTRPEVYDEATAKRCFDETVQFFNDHLK